jgi:hypothetical protein
MYSRVFKINTTFFIFVAFIFRLLFVNISLATPDTSYSHKLSAKQFSNLLKRRRSPDVGAQSSAKDFSVVEVCEEDLDSEDDLAKANSPAILSILFSFLNYIPFIPKPGVSFDSIKCNLFPKRYLALSILRV